MTGRAPAAGLAACLLALACGDGGEPGRDGAGGRISLAPAAPAAGRAADEARPVGSGGDGSGAVDALAADSVSPDGFLGAEACAECHAGAYEAWAGSTHGRAGGSPGPRTVVAPFGGPPIRFRDARVAAVRGAGGTYAFEVSWQGRTERIEVEGVVGRGHLVGGGTQGFLARFPDGTLRLLPFEYSPPEGVWFCNTAGRADRGWRPIGPDLALADCTDWPPRRALGTIPRFTNCQECHGSGIRVEERGGARHYDTGLRSLRIDCEECHGPGRRHVEAARAVATRTAAGGGAGRDARRAAGPEGSGAEAVTEAIDGLAFLDGEPSLAVCFRCHAVKDALRPGWAPGRRFEEHYALELPILGDRPYHADGRVRTFAYQATHLFSDCWLDGRMTCVDCHDPHSQGYRDVSRVALEGRFADGQCTGCHPSKGGPAAETHTRHPPGSPGARCVSCHMPYLQQPAVGDGIPYGRSDHVIPIPRPAFDDSLGVTSACRGCHADRTPERLQAEVERLWGPLKPRHPLVEALREARGAEGLEAAAALLLAPTPDGWPEHPTARFAGLALLLERHLAPDGARLPAGVREGLERWTRSADLEVRAAALAALHLARGEDAEVRRLLRARLDSAGGDERALRLRWAAALGYLGDRYREENEPESALAAYRKALEVDPGSAALHFATGQARLAAGDPRGAIAAYERSLELEPGRPLVHVNMGIARAALGDPAGAAADYRAALELDPHEPLAWFNLGNLRLRAGEARAAAEAYERAVEADPGLAPAHFNLARAYLSERRFEDALGALRRGLAFDPDAESARRTAEELERALGR